jgi:glutamate carboxypeptidase
VLELLAGELDLLGMELEILRGDASGGWLIARAGAGDGPTQLVVGHCDTVWPVGTLEDMPFEIVNGLARGPGVYDMKAGLVQMIGALRALHEVGILCEVAPVIVVNSDEETGSRESTPTIRELAARADRALILEPSLGVHGCLKTQRKGGGSFIVEITGRAAHAGLAPGTGSSAILELSYVVQRLFALNDPAAGIAVNVGVIEGGTRSNVVAEEASAVVDVRVARQDDGALIEKAIRSLQPVLEGSTLKVTGRMGRPPMEPTARNRSIWRVARRLGEGLGLDLSACSAGGTSDGNTTSSYTATLDGLGAVGDGAHARDEHVLVDQIPVRAALLALLLAEPPLQQHDCLASATSGKRTA